MRVLDATLRPFIAAFARRMLEKALAAAGIRVRLCHGCLNELAQDADAVAWRLATSTPGTGKSYFALLQEQLAARAQFIWLWTESDTSEFAAEGAATLVRIARKYALPRPWKLSEPPAPACREAHFSMWKWASGEV
jgi:hypothetical protein